MTRIEQLSADQEFNNALATLLNKAFELGYVEGAKRNVSSVWPTDIEPPKEAVLPIDRRDLKKVAEMRTRIAEHPELPLDTPITALQLALRPFNTLEKHGIITIADLLAMSAEEIAEMVKHHFDVDTRRKVLEQIQHTLTPYGYTIDTSVALAMVDEEFFDIDDVDVTEH